MSSAWIFRCIVVVGIVATTGYLHGYWTDRWHVHPAVGEAAARMDRLPAEFGPWIGSEVQTNENQKLIRSGNPFAARQYLNRRTGETFGVLLTCGRPGGMIVEHTPKECYKWSGYEERGVGAIQSLGEAEGPPMEFFFHVFAKLDGVPPVQLQLAWAWGTDGTSWQFPSNPRVNLAKYPVIYKIYVTRELPAGSGDVSHDGIAAFLKDFLPELKATLAARVDE